MQRVSAEGRCNGISLSEFFFAEGRLRESVQCNFSFAELGANVEAEGRCSANVFFLQRVDVLRLFFSLQRSTKCVVFSQRVEAEGSRQRVKAERQCSLQCHFFFAEDRRGTILLGWVSLL